tara:strand:+ start:226 stop:402 length:177 start_codon:yes stop_codon:yes gene_type:complete
MIAAVVANCHRDPKKSKAFRPEDFMPFASSQKSASDGNLENQFMAFARAWNAKQTEEP